jgi:predicted metal-dependent RNase
MASKRKASAMNAAASEEPVDPSDELMFLCLGGGNEVGRSCHIIQYKGKTVMVSLRKCSQWRNVPLTLDDSSMQDSTQPTMASPHCRSTTTSISAP